ncbi:helix-turn-helix domain-containing protein [Desulfotruncus arcticus]
MKQDMNNKLICFLKELEYIKEYIPPEAFNDLVRKATALAEKDDRLLIASEAAKRLGVSRTTIWRWSKNQLLNFYQLPGGQIRIRESDLEDFIEKHRLISIFTDNGQQNPRQLLI